MSRGTATAELIDINEIRIPDLAPTVRLVAHARFGAPQPWPGTGPAAVVRELLAGAGLTADDIDVWEANEAFAAQPSRDSSDLVGATGCLSAVKAFYQLAQVGGRYAVVTMGTGGGQGVAALFARE